MGIKLKQSDTAFFELPKTGTRFVRAALDKCNIEYKELKELSYFSVKNNEDKIRLHSPWWAHKYISNKCCIIRHPISWYESLWKFYTLNTDIFESEDFTLVFYDTFPFDKNFNVFIDRCIEEFPCMYTRIAEQFFGPNFFIMNKILKTEKLNTDLFAILRDLGYPAEMINPILHMERVNQSNVELSWKDNQKEKILYLEQEIVKRFYNE
jgi:hypothetical protein